MGRYTSYACNGPLPVMSPPLAGGIAPLPRKATVAALALLGVGVGVAIAVPMIGNASAATTGTFDQLTWADEFDGPAGSRIDPSKWTYDIGFGEQWGNNEYQTYTDSTANVQRDGQGHLVITARKEGAKYTSGRIKTETKFSQKYGRFEANIKIPRGPGLLPAFWAMGNDGDWPANGEIDIMENVGDEPKTVYGTIHGPGYDGEDTTHRGGDTSIRTDLSADFHRYAIDWSPNSVKWSLDGTVYHESTPANIPAGTKWVFNDQPFYMLLNVAVGGDWPGAPVDSVLPQQMIVDYVRVYAYNQDGTPPNPPAATSPSRSNPPTVSPTGPTGPIVGLGGKCVDVADANPANGTVVQLYTCNNSPAQQWTVGKDGTLRALGKCMDVAGVGTANGTRVQLWDCTGGSNQKWTATGATLRAVNSGRCLDARNVSSADRTPLQIWDCRGGANQQWKRPA
ncbi:family 16 glycosylhydrolase [Actinoplanes sp. NPDC049548]|uniref:ricin-type beta-trefoil lectin domain protein n=1 Tax=Actinoplanes sp. NPDC049548 TaxID=3155152 RepID=UPI003433A4F6